MNQLQTVNPAEYASQPVQAYQPVQAVQPVQAYQPVQAVQPILTVEVIPQVVAEPVVLRQWTDENGYTWRAMDNQETYWWTGTEWQKYG